MYSHLVYSHPVCSDVTKDEQDHRVLVEVWDWDRYTANDFVGGFSVRVGELLEQTKDKTRMEHWYKLLDQKRSAEHFERIIADEDAQKVRHM